MGFFTICNLLVATILVACMLDHFQGNKVIFPWLVRGEYAKHKLLAFCVVYAYGMYALLRSLFHLMDAIFNYIDHA